MTSKPLDRGFNVAVQHIASRLFPNGFDVGALAPNTFEELRDHVAVTGRMKVWSGASDHTVFADPEINWAFRAWHDWCHLSGGFPFTSEGEANACRVQQDHVRALYGDTEQSRKWCKMLDAEINGQVRHKEETGAFPEDQVEFVRGYLAQH